ncbi:hypothetical protein V5O48_008570 [Marasmius crinis-equi]|uniref:Uncharacterized protein n=1 Tax=Marasmius crinis-equi TaxID=585013 RepID=A0ABR3FDW8_9AGAR
MGEDLFRRGSLDLKNAIQALMKSLQENRVYEVQKGQSVDDDDTQIFWDNVTTGLEAPTSGDDNPLTEYNANFQRLQKRQMAPICTTTSDTAGSESTSPMPPSNHPQQHHSGPTPANPVLNFTHTTVPNVSAAAAQVTDSDSDLWAQLEELPVPIDSPEISDAESEMEVSEEERGVSGMPDGSAGDSTFDITTESDVELFSDADNSELGDDFGETENEDGFEVMLWVLEGSDKQSRIECIFSLERVGVVPIGEVFCLTRLWTG